MTYESKILNVTLRKPKIHFVPDVVYAQVPTFEKPNQLLQTDLLIPQVEKKLPAVIFVTGGGLISAKFPQPIEDVKAAIRFLKANAQKFNVDAEKVFLIGDSAGGYLTAFAAVTNGDKIFNVGENLDCSSKITAAVDLYGIADLRAIANLFPIETFYDDAEQANPINYITKNSAPMLLMHGTADNIVPPAQTELLFQALKNHGVEAERYFVPNANHSDDYWQQDEVFALITEFLTAHL